MTREQAMQDPTMKTLPDTDLCHHARFDVYLNGQYVESCGSKASFAARAIQRYRNKSKSNVVTWNATRCALVYCTEKAN